MAHSTDILTHTRLRGGTMPDPDAEAIVGRDAVTLYVRTYNTILRTSGAVRVRAFEAAHQGVGSSLHPRAASEEPDAGAFIYAVQRLPECVVQVERVILGQLPEQLGAVVEVGVDRWQKVSAPGRRREWRWDGGDTLAVSVASASDIDDMIPTLVAYQIEWNKLHRAVRSHPELATRLDDGEGLDSAWVNDLGAALGLSHEDWARLRQIWGPNLIGTLRAIAGNEKDMRVQMLGGTHVGYSKLVDRWWSPIGQYLAEHDLLDRPTYFVSSNPHGIVNLVSGYARRRADTLWRFLDASKDDDESPEIAALRSARRWSNPENVLYYASRLWHGANQHDDVRERRTTEESERGVATIPSVAGFDVCAQVVDLARVRVQDVDPRLSELADVLERTDAVILNVDYPLGMAAYYIGRQVTEWVGNLRGMYVLGKAATLNGAVGDVMIADVVYDEHTGNVYSFPNAFRYADVAPWLESGSALDKQKAVTVRGTFLQNRDYLEFFYHEAYTVVEMEAGPFLSAVYEATYPDRHPTDEAVHFRDLPFDVGLIHYASDTPYTRARTLGSRRLSFEGIDSTYGSTVAILRRILAQERARLDGNLDHGRGDGRT